MSEFSRQHQPSTPGPPSQTPFLTGSIGRSYDTNCFRCFPGTALKSPFEAYYQRYVGSVEAFEHAMRRSA